MTKPITKNTLFCGDNLDILREYVPANVSTMIGALREFIGANQMMAYLVMMTAR